ncbi:DUF4128 domain-containing protein [Paenalcaligenes niemegkensis]|uniref:phage tail terminator-like protein n=1 Tax=Paenalcaligenes niemegkensis TaxID=2895469 RepID=UPI001EE7A8EE|nr:phage tail terminator-like protein [Paenalcaligenes niemegkensis]MCQ9618395.1 DUF4128 domain-containing protein [Paenalcaligenes niemegkensis]
MTYEEIRIAIESRMATFTGIDQLHVDYPNDVRFTPPEKGEWCRLNIQHAPALMAGMADKPYTRKPGQVVIQCFSRIHSGTGALNRLADALEEHFAYWSLGDLECMEASQAVVGEANAFYQINVNIRFRAG